MQERAQQNGCAAFFWRPVGGNLPTATISLLVSRKSERSSILSKPPRVLLVDDYSEMLKAVSRLLELDCEVVGSVSDGSVLLETAQRLEPDVIVLDVNLPNVGSLEACREITRMNPETKVIMFTAMNDANVRQAFFEAGASAFVSKLASGDLLSTIKRLCVDPG
jgi:CheY-like chemotaxis protein